MATGQVDTISNVVPTNQVCPSLLTETVTFLFPVMRGSGHLIAVALTYIADTITASYRHLRYAQAVVATSLSNTSIPIMLADTIEYGGVMVKLAPNAGGHTWVTIGITLEYTSP
jgi:hypothetical protein